MKRTVLGVLTAISLLIVQPAFAQYKGANISTMDMQTTNQLSSYVPTKGKIGMDTTKGTLYLGDGSTAGGFPLAREDGANPFTGPVTMTSSLAVTGTSAFTDPVTMTSNLSVTGTADITGAVGIDGNFDINTNKFTITASSGNFSSAGTGGVTGPMTMTSHATVGGTFGVTGATTLSSTTELTGDFSINTNKWTITASTGNAQGAGTFGVTGAVTLSSNTTIGGTLGVTGPMTMSSNVTITGDIVAGGGFTMPVYLLTSDVGDGVSAVAINVVGGQTTDVVIPWAGSVTGISISGSETRSGGTLTVDATINGSATGLQAVLDGSNTQYHYASQAKDTDTFTAGQRIGVKLTSDGSWAPNTLDATIVVFIETGGAS